MNIINICLVFIPGLLIHTIQGQEELGLWLLSSLLAQPQKGHTQKASHQNTNWADTYNSKQNVYRDTKVGMINSPASQIPRSSNSVYQSNYQSSSPKQTMSTQPQTSSPADAWVYDMGCYYSRGECQATNSFCYGIKVNALCMGADSTCCVPLTEFSMGM